MKRRRRKHRRESLAASIRRSNRFGMKASRKAREAGTRPCRAKRRGQRVEPRLGHRTGPVVKRRRRLPRASAGLATTSICPAVKQHTSQKREVRSLATVPNHPAAKQTSSGKRFCSRLATVPNRSAAQLRRYDRYALERLATASNHPVAKPLRTKAQAERRIRRLKRMKKRRHSCFNDPGRAAFPSDADLRRRRFPSQRRYARMIPQRQPAGNASGRFAADAGGPPPARPSYARGAPNRLRGRRAGQSA